MQEPEAVAITVYTVFIITSERYCRKVTHSIKLDVGCTLGQIAIQLHYTDHEPGVTFPDIPKRCSGRFDMHSELSQGNDWFVQMTVVVHFTFIDYHVHSYFSYSFMGFAVISTMVVAFIILVFTTGLLLVLVYRRKKKPEVML